MLKTPNNLVAFDTETTGLYPWPILSRAKAGIAPDRPFMFALTNMDGRTTSFRAEVDPRTRRVDYRNVRHEMRWLRDEIIGNPKMRVICHAAMFERRMTTQDDLQFKWRCQIDDTRCMARVANPTEMNFQLKSLARKYLQIPNDDEQALKKAVHAARFKAKKRGWRIATKETHGDNPALADYWLPEVRNLVKTYGEGDPQRTMGLALMYGEIFQENREHEGKLWEIYEWERRVLQQAMMMERRGMTYLPDNASMLREFYTKYKSHYRNKIVKMGFGDLNLQSPKQMRAVFIDALGRETLYQTKGGKTQGPQPKINSEQLMFWAGGNQQGIDMGGTKQVGCRLSRNILEWKAAVKVLGFLDAYDFFSCTRADGTTVIHPSWDPAGARTGRFSCSDPNNQQVGTEIGHRRYARVHARQREAWGPRPGYYWYLPDYSQLEVWIFAFVANDPTMMQALLSGEDFHYSTARSVWGDRKNFCTCGAGPVAKRDAHIKECLAQWWRQRAKLVMFSLQYGGGINKIAELVRCSQREAKTIVHEFKTRLPGMKTYMEQLIDHVRSTGTLVNIFGREYPIEMKFAYKAVNYMVQGSCADLLKRAFTRIGEYYEEQFGDEEESAYLIATVHDELISEVHPAVHSAQLMRKVVAFMQADSSNVPNLPVKLPVTMKWTTSNWHESREVKFLKRAA